MKKRPIRRRNRIWLWWLIALFVATYPLLVFLALYLPWFLFDMEHISLVWHDYTQTLLSAGLFSLPTSLVFLATVTLGIFLGVYATRKIIYIERLRKAAVQNNELMTQSLLSESKANIPELPLSILAIQPKRVLWGYGFIAFYLWAMMIVIIVTFQTSAESRLAIPLVAPEAIFQWSCSIARVVR